MDINTPYQSFKDSRDFVTFLQQVLVSFTAKKIAVSNAVDELVKKFDRIGANLIQTYHAQKLNGENFIKCLIELSRGLKQ